MVYELGEDQTSGNPYSIVDEAFTEFTQSFIEGNTSRLGNLSLQFEAIKVYKTEVKCKEGLLPTLYGTGCGMYSVM